MIRTVGKTVLAVVALIGLAACTTFRPECSAKQEPRGSARLNEQLAALAPEGWALSAEVLRFTPENLYEYIDGRAELYLAYDVADLTVAAFESRAINGAFIELSIYDMGTPTDAFGVFSVERSPGERRVGFGRDGYRSGANLFIWKGRHYVRVIASDDTPALQVLATDMAKEATQLLPRDGAPVWGLEVLPKKNRVPQSMRYFKVDAMGLDFLPNTYTADYRKNGDVLTVFVSRQTASATAEAAVGSFVEYAEKYGTSVEHMAIDGARFAVCDMRGAYDIVFQRGAIVAGVSAAPERALAIQAAHDLLLQLPKR